MQSESYTPPHTVLQKYAYLLVCFGMQTRSSKKLPKGSVVGFEVPVVAMPLYYHLQNELLQAGYPPLGTIRPSDTAEYNYAESFFTHSSKAQRTFFPSDMTKSRINTLDGRIVVIADTMPAALARVSPKLVSEKVYASRMAKEWMFEKIDAGKLCWTLGLYGTDAMAKEAGMSTKAYWKQIIQACYLDYDNPVAEWKKINTTVQQTSKKLSALKIDAVHMVGNDADIQIGIGANRAWRAGGGNNIPSYEVFTSPDYRRVNGWIRFNQPLYTKFGARIKGVRLEFKNGECIQATATEGQDALRTMMKNPGANRLGEFSLTDARLSRITKFMAETLFDENRGGAFGNTHVALGSAYRDCFQGNDTPQTNKEWDAIGYNDSVVHEDIVSTSDRTVTALLTSGKEVVIYKKGQFCI